MYTTFSREQSGKEREKRNVRDVDGDSHRDTSFIMRDHNYYAV